MKLVNKNRVYIAIALIVGLCSVSVYAYKEGHGHHTGFKYMLKHYLELNEEQSQQIDALTIGHKDEFRRHKKQMMREFMQLDPGADDYQQQLQSFADDKAEALKLAILEKGQVKAEIHSILTSEQKQKLMELKQKHLVRHSKSE